MDSKVPRDPALSMDHSPTPPTISQLQKKLAIIQLPWFPGVLTLLARSLHQPPALLQGQAQAGGVGMEDP